MHINRYLVCTLIGRIIEFDGSRRGNKMLISPRDKNEARTEVPRGEEGPLCDPGSDLFTR